MDEEQLRQVIRDELNRALSKKQVVIIGELRIEKVSPNALLQLFVADLHQRRYSNLG